MSHAELQVLAQMKCVSLCHTLISVQANIKKFDSEESCVKLMTTVAED